MTKPIRLRAALSATTILAAGLIVAAAPARAQNLPDTGNVTAVTSGLSGGAPGSTNPTFTTTGTSGAQTLQVDLKDNRTILNWNGTGFDIAAGNTVNFKDARATGGVSGRTDNIAVLNRDLSGSASIVSGGIVSDPNIAVYLINSSGIAFTRTAAINTGSFIASTPDLTDADFFDGDSRLSFSGAGNSTIWLDSGASIRTSATSSSSGGRMGDTILIGSRIGLGSNSDATITAGGDVALIAARSVVVQNSAGSPLSIVLEAGSMSSGDVIGGQASITGRNVTLAGALAGPSAALGIQYSGSIVATGATQTDRGIVLTMGSAAPGVTLGSVPSNDASAPIKAGGEIRYTAVGNGSINSARDVTIAAATKATINSAVLAQGRVGLIGGTLAVTDYASLTGAEIALSGTRADLSGALLSTVGDITFGSGLDVRTVSGTITSARDILGSSLEMLDVRGTEIRAGRDLTLDGKALWLTTSVVEAQRSIRLSSDVPGMTYGGTLIFYDLQAGQDVTLTSSGGISGHNVTATNGFLSALGGSVELNHGVAASGIQISSAVGDIKVQSLTANAASADIELNSARSLTYRTDTNVPSSPVLSAGRDVKITTGQSAFFGNVTAGRDVIGRFGDSVRTGSYGSTIRATTGKIDLSAGLDPLISNTDINRGGIGNFTLVAGTFVEATARGIALSNVTAQNGSVQLTATGEASSSIDRLRANTISATGNVLLNAMAGTATVQGAVAGGTINISGNDVSLGSGTFSTPGAITLTARTGRVISNATVLSNSDGIGSEAILIETATSPSLWGSLRGGTARQSDVLLRFGAGVTTFSAGTIHARSLQAAWGSNSFEAGLSGLSQIDIANLGVTNSIFLHANTVALKNLASTHGTLDIAMSGSGLALVQGSISAFRVKIATGGTLWIDSGGRIFASTEAILSANDLINFRGAGAISAPRWLIYLPQIGNAYFNNLNSGNTAIWNATLATRDPATISGSRYVFAQQQTLTFSTTNFDKIYGTDLTGSTTIPYIVTGFHPGVAGAFLGDTAATAFSGNPLIQSAGFAERASVAGGPYAQTIEQGSLTSSSGYAFAFAPSTGLVTVTPKAITGSITADDKTYDGTTTGSGSIALNGVVAGDSVGTTGSVFTFSDKNAGVGKTVTVTGTALNGADSGNYTLTVPASALADILQKALTATVSVNGKTYDGTTAATGTVSLNGVVAGDSVGTTGTVLTFADKNAGTGKTVNVTGTTLTGTDSGNYTLTIPATALADILQKAITGSITANGKTYDGTTAGSGSVTLNGVLVGDSVGTSGSVFTFADKNAGTGKTVNVTGTTLNGADAGNYTLTIPATALADILQKAITGSITANSKTYDGTTNGSGSIALDGVVAGDSVGTTGSVFTFSDKNAGVGKTVTVTGTALNGADSGNYTLTVPASALADILQKALTATVSVNGKTYDGTTAATGTVSLNGVVAGDSVGTTGTVLTFADKNAGTGKAVTVAGTTLNGADAGNYTLTIPATALADILQKALTATVSANGKTYDGTTAGTGSVSLNGVIAGDSVGTTGSVFTFADKNAGTGKTVNVTGTTLSGADSGNYTLTVPASALADILQKAITATVSANGKTYDGTTAGTGSVALNGVIAGDSVGTTGSVFTFTDKNAGTGKTVNVTGTTLNGTDSGNYTLTIPATAVADILRKAITATVSANGKTYDGTTAATGSVALNGVVAGDSVGTTGSVFTFADKNAGAGKTVNVTGTTLNGADSANYTLTVPASALADILQKALTATVSANGKTYDGTTAATGSVALDGVVSGDVVSTGGITFTFTDKNAGTGKTVAVGGGLSGADAGNYTVSLPATVLADILKKSLTATVSANGKTYDGTTAATGTVALNGVVSGDAVSTGGITFTFSDKNAGAGKSVAVGGNLSGADAGNYTVDLPATVLADILQKALTATVTANGKTYDGTTAATGSVALNGVVAGDSVGTSGTVFTFTDKNAGTGKTVAVSGTTLTGTDSGNYTLTIPASVLADIAKRGLSVSADDKEKYSRDADPALTYTITLGSLVAGDQLSGALTRAEGETPGNYAIGQGSLSAGDNYVLTFTPGTLTISIDPATNQPQTLRAVPLPSGIQAPSAAGPDVSIDTEALCAEDTSCVVN